MIAAGGALGGLFVSVVAPLAFRTLLEWQIGVLASSCWRSDCWFCPRRRQTRNHLLHDRCCRWSRRDWRTASIGDSMPSRPVDADAELLRRRHGHEVRSRRDARQSGRCTGVSVQTRARPASLHGCQFADPAKRHWPTTYYGETSGVGRAILGLQKSGPDSRRRAIGLGVGTLAAYARPGDVFRFYEINPK